MARLSAVAGYEWINPLTYTLPFRTVNGTRELTSTFVYSLQSPHVELIQQVPDSPWTAAPGNSVHHLGYFTDDLAETARKLEANGFTFEATADTAPPDLALFAYYIDCCVPLSNSRSGASRGGSPPSASTSITRPGTGGAVTRLWPPLCFSPGPPR